MKLATTAAVALLAVGCAQNSSIQASHCDGRRTSPAGYRSAVVRVPAAGTPMLVAVGPTGSDYSMNGGQSCQQMRTVGYHSASFAADGAGWAVGADGGIARFAPPN